MPSPFRPLTDLTQVNHDTEALTWTGPRAAIELLPLPGGTAAGGILRVRISGRKTLGKVLLVP